MEKKVKQFKPFKNFRYLVGSVSNDVCVSDLKQYNKHRYKIFTATPRVDNRPLMMHPANYLKKGNILNDVLRLKLIDKENKELLKRINIINRKGGKVDSYNPLAYRKIDNWKTFYNQLKAINKENKVLYRGLMKVRSFYAFEDLKQHWIETLGKMKHSCKMPYNIMNKVSLDETLKSCPSISEGLEKGNMDRPLCFLEFQEKHGRPVGRILIELYYDHVPVTVQNFLEICNGDKLTYKNCLVHRIVKGKYLETGDITKGNGRGGFSIYGETFHEENHMLKHTRPGTAGILSMKRIGMSENNSQFCITFAKMEQLDHKNVVFGKVIKGNETLFKIEAYGRKIGKPYAEIIISKCGQLQISQN